MSLTILVVEDDNLSSALITKSLKAARYEVDAVLNGRQAINQLNKFPQKYNLIILDIMLPDTDGLEVCKQIRNLGFGMPILMLSGKDTTNDKIKGLSIGGDDYLTKPFDSEELIARVVALLRRTTVQNVDFSDSIKVKNLEIRHKSHQVLIDGKEIKLTNLEFRLLYTLGVNRGRVMPREEIIDKVWNMYGARHYSNTISVHMKELRKKIKDNSQDPIIVTVRGIGYRMASE